MTAIDPHIFRAYDIRGKASTQITEEACLLIGRAFGTLVRERYGKDNPSIVVGRDARTHGLAFETSLIQGLVSAGCEVLSMGQTPSPLNYFTICHQQLDGGVQITASHNPADDNGLKLQIREAEAFCGDDLQMLRYRIEAGDFLEGEGSVQSIDAVTPYIEYVSGMFEKIGVGFSVVIDSGNGVAGPVYSGVFESIGANVIGLYIEPDGTFPNHPADPSQWSTLADLQKTVLSQQAHIGLAFDGDGDRLGLVDETGTIRTADDILLLLAKDHLLRHPGAPVVFTVSNSGTLPSEIDAWGGKPVMCKVGHSFVEHAMSNHKALLGGEQSGHFFCGEAYFGYDDALVAALRVFKIFVESGKLLSELFEEFPKVFQAPEQRPHCPDDKKTEVIQKISEYFEKQYPVITIDGVRIDFGDGAWAGIRQSNTSPCLSVCMEARSEERLAEIQVLVSEHLGMYEEIS